MPKPVRTSIAAALRWISPLALAAATLASPSAQAVTVLESGDAGKTLATAQVTSAPAGPLTDIFGSINAVNDADLFLINITNPGAFSATTVNVGSGTLDTQLFLFKLSGAPVYANDDTPSGTSLLSTLTAGSSFGPVTAGLYYVGISLSGYEPVNSNGQLLFAPAALSTDIRGPAPSLQPNVLGGFDGSGFLPVGTYDIQLTGAVAAVPEPSTALMFLLAGGLGALKLSRRQRESSAAPIGA